MKTENTKQMGAVTISRNGYVQEIERENARLRELVKEVTDWHKTPDSGEYNECDVAPCHWCEMANDILSNVEVRNPHPKQP